MDDDYVSLLASTMHCYQLQSILCDTVIKTSDLQVSAHSVVLAAASNQLRNAFAAGNGMSVFELDLYDYPSDVVRAALHYVYTGRTAVSCCWKQCRGMDVYVGAQLVLQALGINVGNAADVSLDEEHGDVLHSTDGFTSAVGEPVNAEKVTDEIGIRVNPDDHVPVELFEFEDVSLVGGTEVSVPTNIHEQRESDIGCTEDTQPYVCSECNLAFGSAQELCAHAAMHEHHSPQCGIFICDVCGKQFTNKSTLRQHMSAHSSSEQQSCSLCAKTFLNESSLSHHLNTHGNEKICGSQRVCDVCDRRFRTASGLRKHRQVHSNGQRFRCSACEKTFAFASVLREHERVHSTVCAYVCEVCGRAFKHMSNMLRHNRAHSRQSVQQSDCESCGSSEPCRCQQTDEQMVAVAPNRKRFQCDICKKCFASASYQEMHSRVHTGERPYQCQICEFSFKQQSNLTKHMRTHSGDRPYSCRYCKKKFSLKSNWHEHEKIHTNDRQFSCNICDSRFITASALRAHVVRHNTGKAEERFACPETGCDCTFSSDTMLKQHRRQCHGSSSHICKVCGKTVSSAVALRRHAAVHNSSRSHVCKVCSKDFKNASNLRAHQMTHHNSELSPDSISFSYATEETNKSKNYFNSELCKEPISESTSLEMTDYQLICVMDTYQQ